MSTFVPENTETCVRIGFTLEKEETKLTRTFAQMPFVPSDETLKKERCEQILSIQAQGLKKRYEHTGAKTAVIGVSGGLDSTLALLVTARAFARERQKRYFSGDDAVLWHDEPHL